MVVWCGKRCVQNWFVEELGCDAALVWKDWPPVGVRRLCMYGVSKQDGDIIHQENSGQGRKGTVRS